jgi:hypothetical protein
VSYEKLYEQAIYWKEKYQSTLKEGEWYGQKREKSYPYENTLFTW